LRLLRETHEKLRETARLQGLSLNELCARLIERGLNTGAGSSSLPRIIQWAKQEFGEDLIGVILFGSQARGDADDQSDTDVLVVLAQSVKVTRELYRKMDEDLGASDLNGLSVHFAGLPAYKSRPGSLWLECSIDGRVLYDPRKQLTRLLQEIRDLVVSGRVVRGVSHGQGYWVFK